MNFLFSCFLSTTLVSEVQLIVASISKNCPLLVASDVASKLVVTGSRWVVSPNPQVCSCLNLLSASPVLMRVSWVSPVTYSDCCGKISLKFIGDWFGVLHSILEDKKLQEYVHSIPELYRSIYIHECCLFWFINLSCSKSEGNVRSWPCLLAHWFLFISY